MIVETPLVNDDSVKSFFKAVSCPKCGGSLRFIVGSLTFYWKCDRCGHWIVSPPRQVVEKQFSEEGTGKGRFLQ